MQNTGSNEQIDRSMMDSYSTEQGTVLLSWFNPFVPQVVTTSTQETMFPGVCVYVYMCVHVCVLEQGKFYGCWFTPIPHYLTQDQGQGQIGLGLRGGLGEFSCRDGASIEGWSCEALLGRCQKGFVTCTFVIPCHPLFWVDSDGCRNYQSDRFPEFLIAYLSLFFSFF